MDWLWEKLDLFIPDLYPEFFVGAESAKPAVLSKCLAQSQARADLYFSANIQHMQRIRARCKPGVKIYLSIWWHYMCAQKVADCTDLDYYAQDANVAEPFESAGHDGVIMWGTVGTFGFEDHDAGFVADYLDKFWSGPVGKHCKAAPARAAAAADGNGTPHALAVQHAAASTPGPDAAATAGGGNLKPLWRIEELPWLRALEAPEVVRELAALAAADAQGHSLQAPAAPGAAAAGHLHGRPGGGGGTTAAAAAFEPDFGPSSSLAEPAGAGTWSGLTLMNKGLMQQRGCHVAPLTCGVLERLRPHLAPRLSAPLGSEVGARLLKLAPRGRLRAHRGPGGRLVAHLGLRIPEGASMTLAGRELRWREGKLSVFDDSFVHSAENRNASEARYILHVAFPREPTRTTAPHSGARAAAASMYAPSPRGGDAPVILSRATPHARMDIAADCTVRVTNLRNNVSSLPEPLARLYNRVADAHATNLEPCTAAAAMSVPAGTVRLTAAHGYGTLDLGVTAGANWFTFSVVDMSAWAADPREKHIVLATMCPTDMCPPGCAPPRCPPPLCRIYPPGAGGRCGPDVPASIVAAPYAEGRFMGLRGSEGAYPDSAGFFTISSQWQSYSSWMYLEEGQKLVYTLCRTDELPLLARELRAAESISQPSSNRARTWWWVRGGESELEATIADAKAMGVELLFYMSMLSNDGDYAVAASQWPSGLATVGEKIRAAGLEVGLHMISSGAQTCHGNVRRQAPECADVVTQRPDVFVPQGLAPRDWYWAQTAGTWYVIQTQSHTHSPQPTAHNTQHTAHSSDSTQHNDIMQHTQHTQHTAHCPIFVSIVFATGTVTRCAAARAPT